MSIAGGVHLAIERGAAIGCTAIQIFTKSSNQWAARDLPDEEVALFRAERARLRIDAVVAHDSYLINLCTPDDRLHRKSIEACLGELQRCERLGVAWLVTHPGSHIGQGAEFGIRRLAAAIDEIHGRLPSGAASIALETMAGQGSAVGSRFEEIAAAIARTRDPERIGVCLDTCHVFAAGYDLRTREGYQETMRRFDGEIGLRRLCAVHVNDSKKDLGCRVDRHEHIGKGCLGREPFQFIMNDPRLLPVPLLLETPKGEDCREDVENLEVLMGLVEKGAGRGARAAAAAPEGGR
jgi:deoxyribonuclease-4